MCAVQLAVERLVRGVWSARDRIEDGEDARARVVKDLAQHGVVGGGDGWELDALALVKINLVHEDLLHEEVVQPLVGVVDADLLEGILVEHLEAEDIEDTDDVRAVGARPERLVDCEDEVVEHARVKLRRASAAQQ